MRITIVGAGFCGTALALRLLRQAGPEVEVCLVGEPASFGRGVAYGLARDEHFLNVRAQDMGLDEARPGGFADWLDLAEGSRQGFLPRGLFGDYLADSLERAQGTARLTRLPVSAVSLQRLQQGFRVHLADGADFVTDTAVLAVGALPPGRLPQLSAELDGDSRYIGRPWHPAALDGVPASAQVLVVGTGLTMADVVLTLRRRGHQGRITAISRHGLLPQRHRPRGEPAVLPPALSRLAQHGSPRELLHALRGMASVGGDWRPLVDGLRLQAQTIWRRFDDAQRRQFLRHLQSLWGVHRHRIAPEVADELDTARADGQLAVEAARLLHAGPARDGLVALLRQRGATHAKSLRVDAIVRATGFETDIAQTRHALLTDLRDSEIIAPDPLGLGIDTLPGGEALDRQGVPVPGLYVLGPLQRGAWWEITAVPELRVAATRLADRLLRPGDAERARSQAHARGVA